MSDFDGFDFNIEDAGSDNSAIPAGDYPCVVTTCEKKKSQANNDMIWLELEVTGDKYAGWMVRKPFMLWQDNPTYLGYAKADWARLCKSLGFGNENPPKSAHDLHGKAFIVSLAIEEAEADSDYGDSNKIVGYKPLERAAAPKAADLPPSMGESSVSPSESSAPSKPSL